MASDDWAIVVGIKNYFDPDLSGLEGPENDARDFHRWVTSGNGGDVPAGQAALVCSSDYRPPFTTSAEAMPTAEAVKLAFDHLKSIAAENQEKGLGRVVGRRLYIFLSGHGFSPDSDVRQTALLTAEASVASAQLSHILGPYMADFFWRAKYFDEILLFMDCCRDLMDCAQLFQPYTPETGSNFDAVKRFYAYGARVGKESREWRMADGNFHGVFTKTLLHALEGGAYDSKDPTRITAASLRDQLYNGFPSFLSDVDRANLDVRKEPQVDYEDRPSANFTIVQRAGLAGRIFGTAIPKYSVRFHVSPAFIGRPVEIRDKDLQSVAKPTLIDGMTIPFERGFYSVELDNALLTTFEVATAETDVHV